MSITSQGKKERIKVPFLGILLLLITAWTLSWGVTAFIQNMGLEDTINGTVIVLEEPVVKPENEGKLVMVRGRAVPENEYVVDSIFGVSAPSAKLYRRVEMLQWFYERDEDGKDIWTRAWYPGKQPGFIPWSMTHKNPESMPYEKETTIIQPVWVGEFLVPEKTIQNLLATSDDVSFDPDVAEALDMEMYQSNSKSYMQDAYKFAAAIGDIRVTFSYADPALLESVTLIGRQTGNTLTEYVTPTGWGVNLFWSERIEAEDAGLAVAKDVWYAYLGAGALALGFGIPGVISLRRCLARNKRILEERRT